MTSKLLTEVTSTMASVLNTSTMSTNGAENVADSSDTPSPIFLRTHAAQGIAGAFVAAALFLTCQQVSYVF